MAKKDDKADENTGHKQEPAPIDAGGGGNADGSMPMGMTGGASSTGEGDPDQKSTHNAPKTVESNLPDGSPKFADPKQTDRRSTPTGRYEVVSRISTKNSDKRTSYEPGEIVELDAKEAASLGDNVKPAR